MVGSDSSPSRESAVVFQEADTDNEMNGFGSFEDGFTLESANTTCTVDSFFPISGSIDMRGGTIYLSKDLRFDSGISLTNMGSIYGNGLSVECSEKVTTVTVFASGQTAGSSSSWEQKDSKSFLKLITSLDWTYDDNYIVIGTDAKDGSIYSFDGSVLTFVDDIAPYAKVNSVRAHPTGYYFVVVTDYIGPKYELVLYKLSGSSLSEIDKHDVGLEVQAVGWSADGNYVAFGSVSEVRVYSFASELLSHVYSLALGAGEAVVTNAICWDQTGDYYTVGVGHTINSKVRIYYFNGSSIVAKDYVDTGADAIDAVDWSKTGSWIAVGTSGSFDQLRVYEYDSDTDTLSEKTKLSVGGTVRSVHWNSDSTLLLVGKGLDSGGTELRVYTFDQDSSTLTLDKEAEKTTNINAVRWSHDDSYFAYGDDALNTVVYSYVAGAAGADYFSKSVIFDNVSFVLRNDMSWKMATTIQGVCTIDARDNVITIENTGVITVTTGAQLTIENAELQGVTNQNLVCVDNTASIILKNCVIRLSQDFSFDVGSVSFEGEVIFTGTNKFIYSSSQSSAIASHSTLMFDVDTTFSYVPSTADRDLLSMVDDTSFLYLNGCTLYSTSTGLRLTKGTLFLDNAVVFESDGTGNGEAICIGDGTAINDLTVKILSDADIDISGEFHYNNVN